MFGQERSRLVVVGGWLLVVVFGGLVAVVADEPGSGAMFAGVGLVMAVWVALRPGVAAFAVSVVLGLLHTAEQTAYLAVDLTESAAVTMVLGDTVGLLGGLLVVGGSAVALRARRRRSARVGELVG
jgi:hypothetical protein